jgi:hypothetical protein
MFSDTGWMAKSTPPPWLRPEGAEPSTAVPIRVLLLGMLRPPVLWGTILLIAVIAVFVALWPIAVPIVIGGGAVLLTKQAHTQEMRRRR